MSQLNLSVGEEDLFVFETRLPVMVSHLNAGNQLAHESILTLLQEARMQYLSEEGMTETSLKGSVGFLISQANFNYRAQAAYGDELCIQIYASRFKPGARLFSLNYQVIRTSDNTIIADAATQHAFYDYQARRITSAPQEFYWMVHRNLQLITLAA
jgi:acyl-CoA thioesterase FadM